MRTTSGHDHLATRRLVASPSTLIAGLLTISAVLRGQTAFIAAGVLWSGPRRDGS